MYLECSKVNHVVNIRVVAKDLVQSLFIVDVDLVEHGALAADELYPVHHFFRGVAQIVDNDNLVIGFQKRQRCERTNIPRTTVSY